MTAESQRCIKENDMEGKITTKSGNVYEKWQAFVKQPGIEYVERINTATGKRDRKWKFRFRFRDKVIREVIGWESHGLSESAILKMWAKYEANRTLGQPPFSPGHATELQDQAMAEALKAEAAARANTLTSLFAEAMQLRDILTKPEHTHNYRTLFTNWIEPVIGALPIQELKAVHIASVLKNMQEGTLPRPLTTDEKGRFKAGPRSTQTQGHVWNVIRVIWTYATDNGIVTGKYPGAKIKPKVDNERMRYLSSKEADAVLAELRGTGMITTGGHGTGGRKGSIDAWGKALMSLHCGLRAGEILALTWRNVNLSNCLGIVYDTKNKGSSRNFYMTVAVVKMLEERIQFSQYTKPGDLIFPGRSGEKISEMGDVFTRCFLRLEINKGDESTQDKVVFHTFRHTFATWLAQRGTPMSVIAELMGHSITKTTERYVQYAPKTVIKDAINFFSGMHETFKKDIFEDRKGVIDIMLALPE